MNHAFLKTKLAGAYACQFRFSFVLLGLVPARGSIPRRRPLHPLIGEVVISQEGIVASRPRGAKQVWRAGAG